MIERIIIAGSGGQGVMLLGKVIAEAAMRKGCFVTWLPAYGPEVRGGTAHCTVVISDQEIGSPYVNKADTLIILNQPSLDKFKSKLSPKGVLILNASLASSAKLAKIKVFYYPFTDLALKLGNIKIANMVALGCYLADKKLFSLNDIFNVFEFMTQGANSNLVEINKKALQEGAKLKNG
ncbi:MAG: 2-oxoacid:acceptor oxidoreductase family protein [Candidatus Omnitrophica bacterium]|jgi:2-oxoglutarate ferredoxin oxidoreductase subunit gamma|nr:2-oxoacid:acceptor oxidoreductase family protein [Candidatus Omnitrophota bacterium]